MLLLCAASLATMPGCGGDDGGTKFPFTGRWDGTYYVSTDYVDEPGEMTLLVDSTGVFQGTFSSTRWPGGTSEPGHLEGTVARDGAVTGRYWGNLGLGPEQGEMRAATMARADWNTGMGIAKVVRIEWRYGGPEPCPETLLFEASLSR